VRCFADDDIVHVAGRVDPVADITIINTELALADLEAVDRAIQRTTKLAKANPKDAARRLGLLERAQRCLDEGRGVRSAGLDESELLELRDLSLLTAKPILYVANVAEVGGVENPWLDAVRDLAVAEGAEVIPVCAALEAELAQLDDEGRAELLAGMGLEEPGLNRLVRAGYRLLDLLTFFTAGPKEVRAWTVRRDATAPEAAGRIHTDFERGFIRAEVTSFDDFVRFRGEQGAREAGRLRLEGRNYVVQEGDVMHFRFNV
jgi:GTP-binding protein YchF